MLPLKIPWLGALANRVLVRFWPFHHLALTNFTIARPLPSRQSGTPPTVSVIVPARNEAGNIPRIFPSVPASLPGCELIFVEGHSRDNTHEAILQQSKGQQHVRARLQRQVGVGKGDAVRLVYPMEKEAMRYLNLLGNKLFGFGFSWLLGQKVRDTLCGTKVLWRSDYQRIAANRAHFGDFDPFGDFDLLFGAARLNLKILDLPIRYHRREYGETNIERWRHGWLLLHMLVFAMRRLKFM